MTPDHYRILAMLQVNREFRDVVSKQYGVFNGLTSRPLLLRPSIDFLDFRDLKHLKEYTDKASSSSRFRNNGVKVKHAFPQYPLKDPAEEIWKAILLFTDLERITFYIDDFDRYQAIEEEDGKLDASETIESIEFYRKHMQFKKACIKRLHIRFREDRSEQYMLSSIDTEHQPRLVRMPTIEYIDRTRFIKAHMARRDPSKYGPSSGMQVPDSRVCDDHSFW
ncbi:hypothetical protein SBOR_7514 [Sclerotinia borealis F-4128]|uniref:Uncharacterized protein n=1 Tax=Sclerotinia borealis (strain F-4128) TaxID=1432307 RepID=W9CB65_SCLBF|nr:hypothetical protein SBOR_7514 [Sclerotinia borealis F-4128]